MTNERFAANAAQIMTKTSPSVEPMISERYCRSLDHAENPFLA